MLRRCADIPEGQPICTRLVVLQRPLSIVRRRHLPRQHVCMQLAVRVPRQLCKAGHVHVYSLTAHLPETRARYGVLDEFGSDDRFTQLVAGRVGYDEIDQPLACPGTYVQPKRYAIGYVVQHVSAHLHAPAQPFTQLIHLSPHGTYEAGHPSSLVCEPAGIILRQLAWVLSVLPFEAIDEGLLVEDAGHAPDEGEAHPVGARLHHLTQDGDHELLHTRVGIAHAGDGPAIPVHTPPFGMFGRKPAFGSPNSVLRGRCYPIAQAVGTQKL